MWLHFRWFFKHKLEIDQLGAIGSGLCSRFSSTVKVLSLLSNTMLGFVTSGLAGESNQTCVTHHRTFKELPVVKQPFLQRVFKVHCPHPTTFFHIDRAVKQYQTIHGDIRLQRAYSDSCDVKLANYREQSLRYSRSQYCRLQGHRLRRQELR